MQSARLFVNFDNLLLQIGTFNAGIQAAEEEFASKVERLKIEYQPRINALKERKAQAEKELMGLAKERHVEVFGEGDKADFPHGILFYTVSRPVIKIRKMLENLKKMGKEKLIKIAESPDWDKIEKLTDAELIELGTERKKHAAYEYEIKSDQKGD